MYYNEKEYSTKPDINGTVTVLYLVLYVNGLDVVLISRHTNLTDTIRVRKLTYL